MTSVSDLLHTEADDDGNGGAGSTGGKGSNRLIYILDISLYCFVDRTEEANRQQEDILGEYYSTRG